MKSENFKVLKNKEGNRCRFNCEAFAGSLKRKKTDLNAAAKKEKKKSTTLNEIMNEIAEKSGFSFEAVKNWYRGYNGPSEYKAVSVVADVLKVPESDLITLFDDSGERMREMTAKEKDFVEMIYGKCVEAFYKYADGMTVARTNAEIKGFAERRLIYQKEYEKFADTVNEIHRLVAARPFSVNEVVASKLHNLLCEFTYIDSPMDMDRWAEICTVRIDEHSFTAIVDTRELDMLKDCYTREDGVSRLGVWYIEYEIDLAERYSHLDNIPLPESYFENVGLDGESYREDGSVVPDEDLLKFGCLEQDVFGKPLINARMVYEDQMVTFIKTVFLHDFPDLAE